MASGGTSWGPLGSSSETWIRGRVVYLGVISGSTGLEVGTWGRTGQGVNAAYHCGKLGCRPLGTSDDKAEHLSEVPFEGQGS